MVEWVELRRRDVVGSPVGVAITDVIVQRQEVNVVHDNVVTRVSAEQESNVEEGSTVEPGSLGGGGGGGVGWFLKGGVKIKVV